MSKKRLKVASFNKSCCGKSKRKRCKRCPKRA